MLESSKRPYRSRDDRFIFGVCGGLAKHYDLDSTLIRIVFILLTLTNGVGIVLYLVLALIMPNEGDKPVDRRTEIHGFAEDIGQRAKALADEAKREQTWRGRSRNVFGGIIVLIGLIMLLERVAPAFLSWLNWGVVWPVLIIFIGLYLIIHKD